MLPNSGESRAILSVQRRVANTVVLFLFAFVAVAACSKNNDGLSLAELEASCSVNSDCVSPLVCAFKSCHVECTPDDGGGSRDCPNGEQCLASDRPYYVCQNPDEKACTYNSDCPSPLVCGRDLTCRDQCQVTSDCQSGQLCVTGTCANVTELVDGGLVAAAGTDAAQANPTCSYNSDCVAPEVCRTNGLCGLECKTDRDCALGQSCIDNRCGSASGASTADGGDATVGSKDGGTGTGVDVPDGAPAGYGASCNFDSDCTPGLICNRANACTYECVVPSDCDVAHGFCCSQYHTCLTGAVCSESTVDAATEGGSTSTNDGGADAGKPCTNDSNCQDGIFCNGVEQCLDNHCIAAPVGGCDDADPCTADTCTEATQSCSHVATGPIDQDHDGHYATSCGTGGDDCDDTNPDVYTGHPELCDFIDNNCNGQIDEGVWTEGTATQVGASNNGNLSQPPAAVRLSDGSFVFAINEGAGYQVFGDTAAYKVSASFAPITSANITPGGSGSYSGVGVSANWPSIATNGTNIAYGDDITGNASGSHIGFSALDLTHVTNAYVVNASSEGPAFVTWVGAQSQYIATWADNHIPAGSTATVYVASIAPGTTTADGALTGASVATRQLLAAQTDCATPTNDGSQQELRVISAAGSSSVLVAYTLASTTHVRWVLMDTGVGSNIVAPVDTTQADSVVAQQAYYDGTNFVLLTSDTAQTIAHIRRINAASGVVIDDETVANYGQSGSGFSIAPLHGGYIVAAAYGSTIRYGFTPNLATAFTFTEFGSYGVGNAVYAPFLLPIDDKHVVAAWHALNGNYVTEAAILTCGT